MASGDPAAVLAATQEVSGEETLVESDEEPLAAAAPKAAAKAKGRGKGKGKAKAEPKPKGKAKGKGKAKPKASRPAEADPNSEVPAAQPNPGTPVAVAGDDPDRADQPLVEDTRKVHEQLRDRVIMTHPSHTANVCKVLSLCSSSCCTQASALILGRVVLPVIASCICESIWICKLWCPSFRSDLIVQCIVGPIACKPVSSLGCAVLSSV